MASCESGACSSDKSHDSKKSVEQHDKHKKDKPWTYHEYYSKWQFRKEKCKPQFCPGKPFKYNGVYFSRQHCPPLTNWLDVFNAPPGDQVIIVEEEE